MKCHSGFTLIELLVVITIISIITSVALLTIHQNENRRVQTFAQELTQRLTLAEQQALLQPAVLGLNFHEQSYTFFTYQSVLLEGKTINKWLPNDDPLLGQHVIPAGVAVKVKIATKQKTAEKEEQTKPQIIISTNGDITPFTLYIGKQDKKPLYAITGEADGSITNKILTND